MLIAAPYLDLERNERNDIMVALLARQPNISPPNETHTRNNVRGAGKECRGPGPGAKLKQQQLYLQAS